MALLQARTPARKLKGEWAESAFLSRALRLGLIVSKPWGDSAPYDFVVEGKNGFCRVQVKSAWTKTRWNFYYLGTTRTGKRLSYSSRRVDVIVAYVVPEDAWYFIPVSLLGSRISIALFPSRPRRRRGFERYREAWHLLG